MKSIYEDTKEYQEAPFDPARQHQMERYLGETDRATVEQLAERYKALVPPERIEAVRNAESIFIQDREVFDCTYEYESGKALEPGERVLGYSMGPTEGPRIATDYLEVPRVVTHERLHQLSAPGIERELGHSLDEGITEDLAIENMGSKPLEGVAQAYPEERRMAHEVRELCGDDAVERAYFQGDTGRLRACLDKALGSQGLERLREGLGDPVDRLEQHG